MSKNRFLRQSRNILILLLVTFVGSIQTGLAQQRDIAIGATVEVVTGGENLNLRQGPGLDPRMNRHVVHWGGQQKPGATEGSTR